MTICIQTLQGCYEFIFIQGYLTLVIIIQYKKTFWGFDSISSYYLLICYLLSRRFTKIEIALIATINDSFGGNTDLTQTKYKLLMFNGQYTLVNGQNYSRKWYFQIEDLWCHTANSITVLSIRLKPSCDWALFFYLYAYLQYIQSTIFLIIHIILVFHFSTCAIDLCRICFYSRDRHPGSLHFKAYKSLPSMSTSV